MTRLAVFSVLRLTPAATAQLEVGGDASRSPAQNASRNANWVKRRSSHEHGTDEELHLRFCIINDVDGNTIQIFGKDRRKP